MGTGVTATACEICEGPLDDGRPVQYGLDGSAAHAECLDQATADDEGDEDV